MPKITVSLISFFSYRRLVILIILLQVIFLIQLGLIWNLSRQLKESRQKSVSNQKVEEEKVITPGMIRGL